MKFRCASNAAIKNVKIARKKINIFSKIFSTKSPFFFKKIPIFRKYKVYFQILEVIPVILTTYLFRSNNKAMTHENSRKTMIIMSTLYFETPLTAKS